MKLKLERKFKGTEYTIGDLFIDGVFFSNILEDTVRGLTKKTADEGVPVHTTTFNKWSLNQLNAQFAPDLTEDEQIELLRAFNDITSTFNV